MGPPVYFARTTLSEHGQEEEISLPPKWETRHTQSRPKKESHIPCSSEACTESRIK